MMKKPWAKKNIAGFTLMETLMTVAIIAVVAGVVFIGASGIQKNLRQAELDSKAQIIYTAAQNRFTELRASGRESDYAYSDGGEIVKLGYKPGDASANLQADNLCYIKSDTVAADTLLPKGAVDAELENYWVIEYNAASGSVYGVFYSRQELSGDSQTVMDSLRSRSMRMKQGAVVGYYGGDAADTTDNVKLKPTVDIYNGETLTAVFTCQVPSLSNKVNFFHITVTDANGVSVEKDVHPTKTGKTYQYIWALDDLSSDETRFHSQFKTLAAGKITVEVVADCDTLDSGKDSKTENSLFADDSTGDTAVIEYCRHLQNLDSASGVSGITNAQQSKSLDFQNIGLSKPDKGFDKDANTSWYAMYGAKTFVPINNETLQSYMGSKENDRYLITGLTESTAGESGLFGTFYGSRLSDITMTGTKLSGTGNVGALAGITNNTVNITGCRVYLDSDNTKSGETPWITGGTYVGGLVGSSDGKATITKSLAATVIKSQDMVGGLVGHASSEVKIENSYADCYLTGKNAGGLVGGGSADVQISYAAGFISATANAAGLVCGNAKAQKSYAAVSYAGDSNKYSLTQSGNGTGNTYYLNTGDEFENSKNGTPVTYGELCKEIANLKQDFTLSDAADNSYPYNLREGMGLSDYPFPRITGLPHYGDWIASFVSGLVYYEDYGNSLYGFYGANVDTLKKDKTPVGDGYAVAYQNSGDGRVAVEGGYYIKPIDKTKYVYTDAFYQSYTVDGITYYFNPFFAKTVHNSAAQLKPEEPVVIRTARQLYELSALYGNYYANYKSILPKCKFVQEINIDYGSYTQENWAKTGRTKVTVQTPVGSESKPFLSSYDGGGHTVSGISFSAEKQNSIGMFGQNNGTVKDLSVATQYKADGASNVYFSLSSGGSASVIKSGSAYMGTLVGYNAGRIINCAVAGYSASITSYPQTDVYVGGLAGYNAGTITSSSADCPSLTAKVNNGGAHVGGFVGGNKGAITYSYAIGAIDVYKYYQTGNVVISGFAAENGGLCRNSYCATALTVSQGQPAVRAFAPAGNSGCSYLGGGSYYYTGKLYRYETFSQNVSGVTSYNGDELAAAAFQGFTKAVATSSAAYSDGVYPYPACVKNSLGQTAHYGDWPGKADLGTAGMFYWEHENGGSNSGYHITFLNSDGTKSGTTLCTAHEDGGIIDDYGYGYYTRTGVSAAPSVNGLPDFATLTTVNEVNSEFAVQFEGYNFKAYRTADNQLHINNDSANATVTLNGGKYTINPFFANSLTVSGKASGTESAPYYIRSAKQLQYINWNSSYGNATGSITKVSDGSNKKYTYLAYAEGKNKLSDSWNYYFEQTHDVDNKDAEFTPIGSLLDSAGNSSANVYLACFRGKYSGGDYTIKNIKISSPAQCVGLFGVTIGANLNHVVMYSDKGSTIETRSDGKNWYCLGGLVGFAAQGSSQTTQKDSVFDNCSVSGYNIKDNRGATGYGGAGVGGLAGICNMSLSYCTAVTDISINLTYSESRFINTRNMRVGGLVGTSRNTIENCYAGGSISNNAKPDNELFDKENNTSIYCGGIFGGTFIKDTGNLENLVGSSAASKAINCYSYASMPNSEKRCERYSIGSGADLGNSGVTITNCYYYKDNANGADKIDSEKGLSYAEMSNGTLLKNLNANITSVVKYDTVTASENGIAVDGKYSFPGSDTDLNGKNYPFPTILTRGQGENRVNIHYGTWPKVGLFASKESIDVDLISGNTDSSVTLFLKGVDQNGSLPEVIIPKENQSMVDVSVSKNGGSYLVTVTGKAIGTTEITFKYGEYDAKLVVNITAVVDVPAQTVSLFEGEDTVPVLSAKNKNGENFENVKWTLTPEDENICACLEEDNTWKLMSGAVGETNILATATVTIDEQEYSGAGYINVTVKKPTVIGVANSAIDKYNEVKITDKTVSQPAFADYQAETAPTMTDGSQLFVYAVGQDLEKWQITGFADGREVSIGSGTDRRKITITGAAGQVTLEISFKNEADGKDFKISVPYTVVAGA